MKTFLLLIAFMSFFVGCTTLKKYNIPSKGENHMKLGYTILYVPNVEQALAFYEKAFGFKRKYLHESGQYGELETGATTLSFTGYELMTGMNEITFTKNSKDTSPPAIELAFVTDNVEKDFEKAVSNGATVLKKPVKKPWGQLVGYVRDLNGFIVEICSPVPPQP